MAFDFDTAAASMDAHLMAVFKDATAAVYTAPGEAAVPDLSIILGAERFDEDYDEEGRKKIAVRDGSFLVADLPEVVIGASVVADGFTYYVRSVRRDVSMITAEMRRIVDTGRMDTNRVKRE